MTPKKIENFRNKEKAFWNSLNVSPKEYFIDIPDYGIKVRVQQIGSGAPVLFIHGNPNAGTTWASLAVKMQNYNCLIIDRPGCGLSDSVNYNEMDNDKMIKLIITVIEAVRNYFKISKMHIIGSSDGGHWALIYALEKPENIIKMVQEGCPDLVEDMVVPTSIKIMMNPVVLYLMQFMPMNKSGVKSIMAMIGHKVAVKFGVIPDEFYNWYVSLGNDTDTMKNENSLTKTYFKSGKMRPEFIIPNKRLSEIATPTLILWGADDPFGGVEVGKKVSGLIKNSQFYCSDNSGHLPWLDDIEMHAKKINDFLG